MIRTHSLLLSLVVFCLSGTFRAQAASYTVKAGGGGNFTTIQACATAAVAGDTCTVFAGTYPEYVNIPSSGTAGAAITFQVNSGDTVVVRGFTITGQNYITIGGGTMATSFEITDPTLSSARPDCIYLQTTSHITIQGNYIHECGVNQAIRLTQQYPSSYTIIRNNTIAWPAAHPAPPCTTSCGDGNAGILVNGDHTLVDGNDISHVTDFISNYGSFNVIRNNIMHDVSLADFPSTTNQMHVDGIESDCSNLVSALIHSLYENNTITNNLVPNGHGFLLQDEGGCGSHGVIIRENAVSGIGSYYLLDQLGGLYGVKDYNNTIVGGGGKNFDSLDLFLANSRNGAELNNIFYNPGGPNISIYSVDASSTPGFSGGSNLAYCAGGCIFTGRITTDNGNILNRDPLLINPTSNFHLQNPSPARGAGTYLTTVSATDTGSGTSLVVNDAGFFQDGSGIAGADWIRVGTTNTVQISSINYTTNTITLVNGINRSVNDPVYLYKDSNGKVVLFNGTPDIGAYQYGPAPAPPGNLTVTPR